LAWRGKDYYAKGRDETVLLESGDLAALQQLAAAEDFAEKLA
jgi:hypothetical protein